MSFENTLTLITARLRQGRFPNEQAISQGIVLRVLQELGWDTWDTAVVWPEYQTGQGRADFALCHPPSPRICLPHRRPIHRPDRWPNLELLFTGGTRQLRRQARVQTRPLRTST